MRLGPVPRNDRPADAPAPAGDARPGVVIITGSCCIPGMQPFDAQARRVVEQAIAESGVAAELRDLPASNAMFGGAPRDVMARLLAMLNEEGRIGLPAVLVDGEVVSYGVPTVEAVRVTLLKAAAPRRANEQQEPVHGQ